VRGARRPARWAVGEHAAVVRAVETGGASDGSFPQVRDRERSTVALLYPLAHRTSLRVLVALSADGLDPAVGGPAVASAEAVAQGWRAQLDRGMRVELPDDRLQAEVERARAAVLLEGQSRFPDPATVGALEEWGFDAEAGAAWPRLRGRERRRVRARSRPHASWADVERARAAGGATLLGAVRNALARGDDHEVALLPELPGAWIGAPLDVRELPTAQGPLSFSLRWHGRRPALLWDAPVGLGLRAPALDPAWSTVEPRGEALLEATEPSPG